GAHCRRDVLAVAPLLHRRRLEQRQQYRKEGGSEPHVAAGARRAACRSARMRARRRSNSSRSNRSEAAFASSIVSTSTFWRTDGGSCSRTAVICCFASSRVMVPSSPLGSFRFPHGEPPIGADADARPA